MGCLGGRLIKDILEKQTEQINDYFGSINELRAGVIPIEKVPNKPGILAAVELIESTGLPLWAGGLMDQPHIFLMQQEMVLGLKDLWDAINAAADQGT